MNSDQLAAGTEDEISVRELLARLQREPALRSWLLDAPTGALASLGLTLDDSEIVSLLDQVHAMDERPIPVTARDLMTVEPLTAAPDELVHSAAERLAEHHVSGLPVCDESGQLIGIISEFDLIARSGRTVKEVMTRDVVSVPAGASVEMVRALLVSRRLKRVPVVEDGKLVGLISRADLVRELAYRWVCRRCGQLTRARHTPAACPACGAMGSLDAAPPPPLVSTCPTCGRPLETPAATGPAPGVAT